MASIVHVVESFGAGTLAMVSAIANRQAQAGHPVGIADLDGLGAVGAAQALDGAG